MRVRLQSSLPDVILGCWYEIPQNSKSAYIEDLIQQLHSDLDLDFPSSELGLDLEDYDLPRRSRIEGVLREGDILNLKHIGQIGVPEHTPVLHNQLSQSRPYNLLEDVERSSRELQRVQSSRNGRRSSENRTRASQQQDVYDTASVASDATSTIELDRLQLRRKVREWRSRSLILQEAFERVEKDTIRQANALASIEQGTEEQARVSDGVIKGLELQIRTLEKENREHLQKLIEVSNNIEGQWDKFTESRSPRYTTLNRARTDERLESENQSIAIEDNTVDSLIDAATSVSDSDSSSISSSSSDSSEESTSSGEVEELSSKQQGSQIHIHTPKVPPKFGLPHQGSPATSHRNDRRKRARMLQRLIEAGTLPADSNFKVLEEYLEVRDHGASATKEWQNAIFAAAVKQTTAVTHLAKEAEWDYPAEPEEGWEKRLVVKEIECESMHTEERMSVKQYTEAQRNRKRSRAEEVYEDTTQPQRQRLAGNNGIDADDVEFDADLYGDGEIVIRENESLIVKEAEDVLENDLEDGEVESDDSDSSSLSSSDSSSSKAQAVHLTNGAVPSLPSDIDLLPVLTLTSPHLERPGTVIAFKHMEMVNFRPSFSKYKTGRIVQVQGELLVLQLAEADVQEPMYDYEGDRVPGPFDHWDERGSLVDGQIAIHRGELMDPLLVQSHSQ